LYVLYLLKFKKLHCGPSCPPTK